MCALAAEAIRDRDPAKGIVHSHSMHGDPQPGCPGFFKLDAKYNIYWRKVPLIFKLDIHAVKKEHAASTVPLTTWDTKLTHFGVAHALGSEWATACAPNYCVQGFSDPEAWQGDGACSG